MAEKKKRIRGKKGQRGFNAFIPFFVDKAKLKALIESEKRLYVKEERNKRIQSLTAELEQTKSAPNR